MARKEPINSRKHFALMMFVTASFLVQYSNWILGTYIPYGLLLCAAAAFLIWERRGVRFRDLRSVVGMIDWKTLCWLPVVICFGLSCFVGGLGMKEVIDIFTYVVCVLFVVVGSDTDSIRRATQVIVAFAVYYAASVWVQVLFPQVYNGYLSLLPEEVVEKIWELQNEYSSYAGFSTNTGFTAGHIAAGMIVLISRLFADNKKTPVWNLAALLFLGVSLMLTGKRAHLLAIVLVAVIVYVYSVTGKQRNKRLLSLAILLAAGVLALLVALQYGRFIPVIDRLADTITGLFSGEDVTSGRTKLYAYAWKLFSENPVFGVGWSRYRDVMVGVVTRNTEMDVHNIYLQLLAETGAVGFLLIIIPMALTLLRTMARIKTYQDLRAGDRALLLFSLGYQIFFWVYGVTGNPLYDYNYVILYFFACMIPSAEPDKGCAVDAQKSK